MEVATENCGSDQQSSEGDLDASGIQPSQSGGEVKVLTRTEQRHYQGKVMRCIPTDRDYNWGPKEIHGLKEQTDKLVTHVNGWSDSFVESAPLKAREAVVKSLSSDEKEKLIRSLDGYCRQVSWDSLIEQLPPKPPRHILTMIIRAMISKRVFQEIVEDPFFYLDETSEKVPDGGDLYLPTRSQMHNIWQWHKRVNPAEATKWLSQTTRLFFARTEEFTADIPLAEAMWDRRQMATYRIALKLIDDLQPLLPKDHCDESKVNYSVRSITDRAHEINLWLWGPVHQPVFVTLESLGMYVERSGVLLSDEDTNFETRNDKLPGDHQRREEFGHKVLFMYQPLIYRTTKFSSMRLELELEEWEDTLPIFKAVVTLAKDSIPAYRPADGMSQNTKDEDKNWRIQERVPDPVARRLPRYPRPKDRVWLPKESQD